MIKFVFYTKLNRFWLEKIEALREEFSHVEFVTDKDRVENEIENAHAFVGGEIPIEVIRRAKNLSIVFVPFAGVDGVPLGHTKEKGIKISNVHGNAPYVAERGIAMALTFYGRIIEYHNDLKNFQWHGFWAGRGVKDTWNSIQGKSCAVIGVGEIGKHLAKYLKVFDCHVIGFKKRPVAQKLEHFDRITLDLHEALEKAEIIFVTLPLTGETKGMFNGEILAEMEGKFLVNLGRGEIVDEEALYRALEDNILAGAAIDVWYNYPEKGEGLAKPSKYPIHERPNVVLSPHLAGFTPQAAKLNIEQTIDNIRSYIKTGKANFEVDLRLKY